MKRVLPAVALARARAAGGRGGAREPRAHRPGVGRRARARAGRRDGRLRRRRPRRAGNRGGPERRRLRARRRAERGGGHADHSAAPAPAGRRLLRPLVDHLRRRSSRVRRARLRGRSRPARRRPPCCRRRRRGRGRERRSRAGCSSRESSPPSGSRSTRCSSCAGRTERVAIVLGAAAVLVRRRCRGRGASGRPGDAIRSDDGRGLCASPALVRGRGDRRRCARLSGSRLRSPSCRRSPAMRSIQGSRSSTSWPTSCTSLRRRRGSESSSASSSFRETRRRAGAARGGRRRPPRDHRSRARRLRADGGLAAVGHVLRAGDPRQDRRRARGAGGSAGFSGRACAGARRWSSRSSSRSRRRSRGARAAPARARTTSLSRATRPRSRRAADPPPPPRRRDRARAGGRARWQLRSRPSRDGSPRSSSRPRAAA